MVYLFGSAARNEMTDCSDLDFLIVLFDHQNRKDTKKQYYRGTQMRVIPVDAIFVTLAEFQTRSHVGGVCMVCKEEGRLVFESEEL
jgi:predicted nucleotidyltransferase